MHDHDFDMSFWRIPLNRGLKNIKAVFKIIIIPGIVLMCVNNYDDEREKTNLKK